MPSIPQSLLWISLVVLWLFVLVPMLTSKRDAVRRTSDVALATRVLNSAAGFRRLRRTGPAAGHRSDPNWQPQEDADDELDDLNDDEVTDALPTCSAVMTVAVAAKVEINEPDYLDVDVVDEGSRALPVGGGAEAGDPAVAVVDDQAEPVVEDEIATGDPELDEAGIEEAEPEFQPEDDGADDDTNHFEYVEDTSGLAPEADPATTSIPAMPRRPRYDSQTAAGVSARRYRFRKRTVMTMVLSLAVSAAVAFLVAPAAWWVCGGVAGVTMFYLAYLRRQTRIEERVRRRRMQRMARSRLGVENTYDHELDVTPSRLRRPGAVVLEIDDEDPIFEHLDYAPAAHHYDLPRAAGQ